MKRVISIVGPTASGKTALSIKLAQALNAEIISADSRQFYKEMNIGTAVPSKEELASATHHFIQHKSIFDDYNVGDFEQDFLQKAKILFQKNDTVILVGGSGLYVKAACSGLDKLPERNDEIRAKLEAELNNEGIKSLQKQLQNLDPDYYQIADIQNPHRLIRGIEILLQSEGKKMSELYAQSKSERNFECISIGLNTTRALLYERINKRVDIMLAEGLLDEVKALLPNKDLNALNTVGYKELFRYFEAENSLDFAIEEIKKNTRRFAKRQITWFKKVENIKWFDIHYDFDEVVKYIQEKMN
jgi:tRNA dimethylallyltransferase